MDPLNFAGKLDGKFHLVKFSLRHLETNFLQLPGELEKVPTFENSLHQEHFTDLNNLDSS